MADEYEVKGKCSRCGGTEKMKGNDPCGVVVMHSVYVGRWSYHRTKCRGTGHPAVAGSVDEFLASVARGCAHRADVAETALAEAQKELKEAVEANARWQPFEAKVRRKMAKATK